MGLNIPISSSDTGRAAPNAALPAFFIGYIYHYQTGVKVMLKNFLTDETGAELAEYAVAVALLVAIGLVVYATLGNGINDANESTATAIKSAEFIPK